MTRCILSAIRCYSPATEPSGCIYVIDLEEQKILRRTAGFKAEDIILKGARAVFKPG